MTQYDSEAPTVVVSAYRDGERIDRVFCESAEEAAEAAAHFEETEGVRCVVEDLGVAHGPDDVLAPEPEDAEILDDDVRRDLPEP